LTYTYSSVGHDNSFIVFKLERERPPFPTPVSPTRLLPDESGTLFSLETWMVTSLCGERVTFDLKNEDPEVIVKLLKVTSSERGNWMLAGCHYRRKGNVVRAVNIISTMLEGESWLILTRIL
jgi:hypothetical protein